MILGSDHLTCKGGGICFFVSFRNFFFLTTQELEYLFFCRAKKDFFFHNSTLGYMTKTMNQIFIFLQQNQNIFLEKKHTLPPLQVKWSFPYQSYNLVFSSVEWWTYLAWILLFTQHVCINCLFEILGHEVIFIIWKGRLTIY
jgi:hypothetical protein